MRTFLIVYSALGLLFGGGCYLTLAQPDQQSIVGTILLTMMAANAVFIGLALLRSRSSGYLLMAAGAAYMLLMTALIWQVIGLGGAGAVAVIVVGMKAFSAAGTGKVIANETPSL